MLGWAWSPRRNRVVKNERELIRWTREEDFACEAVCRRSASDELDEEAREAMNCTRIDPHPIPENRWRSTELVPIHMGLPPRWDREGKDKDALAPTEDIRGEGCPGGWYRCRFVASLHKYRRGSAKDGARNENLLLSRCEDRLVLEAIDYLEHQEAHSLGYFYEMKDADG